MRVWCRSPKSPPRTYNCNIRRYVDNAPPPEPHDVRAHLHGGVPVAEIDALAHFWRNYAGLRERHLRAARERCGLCRFLI